MAEYAEEVNSVWGIDPTAAGRAREEVQLHESRELSRAEESRAASSTSFQDVMEELDQIGAAACAEARTRSSCCWARRNQGATVLARKSQPRDVACDSIYRTGAQSG